MKFNIGDVLKYMEKIQIWLNVTKIWAHTWIVYYAVDGNRKSP